MKKFFFRRRSISYRGRGNFATQLSFSQPIVKLAVWLYFIICILVICTRVFFMTQADHYRDEITALVSEAAGVDVHAGEFSAGFERFWPVITVRQLELARPGGPVSLTLPEVKARLAWSSLWHFEPRFQLLRISSPDLRITRLDKTTLDIAGFVVNLPEGSDEESDFAASGDSRVAAWLLAQKKLELVNGTITYDDRYSPGAAEVRVMNANVVFEQTLLDWRVAVDGTAHISAEESPHKQGECFTAVARIDRHIFTDTSNPLTWKGQVYVRFSHADVAKLLSRAGFPQFMSSGSGAAEVWAGFADGRITSATADVALLDIHTQLADNLEPLKLAWLESRLYYNGSFGDRAEQTFGVRKLDFMTADRRRLKPTDASVTIRTDSAGQISDGAITVSRLDIGSLIALVPELPLDDAVHSFVTAHAPEGYLKDVSVAFSGNPSDPGNWRPAATFKDLSLKAADGIPGIRAISGSISPLKNGEGFKVVLDSPKSTLSFPGIFRHPDMKFDTLKATAEIVPHPTLTVRLPSFEASNPDAALKGSGSWQATGGPGTLELNGTISRARATAVPYYIPLVVGDDVLDWLEAGILGGSGSNGTFIVKGPLEHFPWDGKHKNDGHFAIEADMTGGRLDFLPSHVRKADGSWETASSWPVLNNIDAHLAFIGNGFEIRGRSATSHDLKASDVVVSMKSYTDADLEITGRAQGDLGRVLRYLNQGRMLNDILSSAFAESKGSGAADVRMNLHIPLSGDIVRNLRVNIDADIRNATFYYGLNLPTVSGVNGSLHITEKSVVTPAPLRGTSPGGKPVTVTAETTEGVMTLGIDAEPTTAELEHFLGIDVAELFFKKLTGTSPVHVDAEIGLTKSRFAVTGRTDLDGIASTLPEPYEKAAGEKWPTTFSVTLPEKAMHVDVSSPGRAAVALRFTRDKDGLSLRHGYAGLGSAPMRAPAEGIAIRVETPRASIDDWQPYILQDESPAKPGSGRTAAGESAVDRISMVEAEIGGALWSDKEFRNLSLTARRFAKNDWHVRVAGDDAAGQIEYNQATSEAHARLKVNLTRFALPDSKAESFVPSARQEAVTTVSDLPDISLVIDDLKVGKRHLGKVEFEASRRVEAGNIVWRITEAALRNAGSVIRARGSWVHTPGKSGETSVSIDGNIPDAGKLLASLDIPHAVNGAPTTLHADLSWNNAPHRPDLSTLRGSFSSEMKRGEFLQIEPGAGRLLSLLSMQHLLRRLTLDFRDVLGKGFAFDSAHVAGTVKNGVLSIPKASVLGSSATVMVGGSISLVRETLDLDAIILPAINAGGPALALSIINPAVGIGTFLTQWVFKDQLSNMFRMEYEIKGPFDDPVVEKASRTELGAEIKPAAPGERIRPLFD